MSYFEHEPRVSLAHSEKFPTGVGVEINREMYTYSHHGLVIFWKCHYITCWDGHRFQRRDGYNDTHACEIPIKTTRQMTAHEIAMLPRGTAFIRKDTECDFYNPSIHERYCEIVFTGVCGIEDCLGYRLPGTTDIRKFEVDG